MRPFIIALSLIVSIPCTQAQEYNNFEPQKLIQKTVSPTGETVIVDRTYLKHTLYELSLHAMHYPPRFDTPRDRDRVIDDIKTLSTMFDKLLTNRDVSPDLLLGAGYINIMAYKLDLPDAAVKIMAIFPRLLAIAPNNPESNLQFGDFLRHSGKPKEALPFLEKALAGGMTQVNRTLGVTWLQLGDKSRALAYLEVHQKNNPDEHDIRQLIVAIRQGKIEFSNTPKVK